MRLLLPVLLCLTASASAQFTVDPGTIIGVEVTGQHSLVEYTTGGVITEKLAISLPGGVPVGVLVLEGRVWVSTTSSLVAEIDLTTGGTIQSFSLGTNESLGGMGPDLIGMYYSSSVIERYDTSGNLLGTITLPGNQSCTGLDSSPTTIFVAAYLSGRIHSFDYSGTFLGSISTGISGSSLSGLSYDPDTDTLWVSTGFGADDIRNYDMSGNLLSSFPTNSSWINGITVVPVGGGPIGTNYCGPANLNSSGQSAVISAFGSTNATLNHVSLTASLLPPNVFGYFLNSDVQGFTPFPPGSKGNLCLAGGIGRHAKQIANSGATGELVIDVDLTALPRPGGTHSVLAGEAWNFQCWFRDNQGGPTSNFTDGIEIVFQ